jgi:hypothetical protein
MFLLDASPPAIIHPAEPWEKRLTAAMGRDRVPIGVQLAVIAELKRLQGAPRSVVLPTVRDLVDFGGLSLGFVPGMTGAVSAIGGGLPALTYTNTANTTVSANNDLTWTNAAIGAAPGAGERRFVFAVIRRYQNSSTATVNNVTIGGVTATMAVGGFNAQGVGYGVYYREVTTGTTATIVLDVSSSGGTGRGGRCSVYRVIAKTDIAVTDFGIGTASGGLYTDFSINAAAGGIVFASTLVVNSSDFTWTVLTKDDSVDLNSGEWTCSASLATPGAGNITPRMSVTSGIATAGIYAVISPAT